MANGLIKFTVRRALWAIPVLFVSSIMVFSMVHLMPGETARALLPPGMRTENNIRLITEQFHLESPIYIQYWEWLKGAVVLDFGTSYYYGGEVGPMVSEAFVRTAYLGLLAGVLGLMFAIPFGIVSAVYKDTKIDHLSRVISFSGMSIPLFWLGLLLILVFATMWNQWFGSPLIPSSGYVAPGESLVGWFRHSIGPAITLGAAFAAFMTRVVRSSMVDVLNEEYITTARSVGNKERIIILVHAFRNSLIPIVTITGYQFGYLLNGSVLVEQVFTYPGLGRLMYQAIIRNDMPLVVATIFVVVVVYVVVNFLVDVSYAYLDPRISYEDEQ